MKKSRPVPLGRLAEYLDALPDDVKQRSATLAAPGAFGDYTIGTWSNRAAMARTIRMQEKGPRDGRPAWRAVIALGVTEGY